MSTFWTALGWILGAVLFLIWVAVQYGGLFFLPSNRRRRRR